MGRRTASVLSAVLSPLSPFLAGAGWALLLLAAVRLNRPLYGPSLSTALLPAGLFAAGVLAGLLLGRGSLRGAGLRLAPAALALLLALFPFVSGLAEPSGLAARVLFAVLVLAAGFFIGREAAPGAPRAVSIALFGGSIGVFAGSAALVPRFGEGAAAVGALLAFAFARACGEGSSLIRSASEDEEDAERPGLTGLAAACLVGLSLPLVFVGWGRTLDLLIGPTFRATGLLAAVALLGISLGSLAARARAGGGIPRSPAAFAAGLVALLLLLFTAISARLPYLFLRVIEGDPGDPGRILLGRLLLVGIAVFPCAAAVGWLGGLLLKPWGEGASEREALRRLLIAGAAGAAASLLLSPSLLPAVGIRGLLLAGAAFQTTAGLALLAGSRSRLRVRIPLAAALLLLLVVVLANPPRWRPSLLNTAVFRYARLYEEIDEEGFLRTYSVLPSFYKEGAHATVLVTGAPGSRFLASNGVVEVSDRDHLSVPLLSGRLPLLLRPATRSVFLAGAEAGIAAGVLLSGSVEEVLSLDAEPAHLEAMRSFTRANRQPWNDPRFRFRKGDPRAALAGGSARYDLIVSEPSIVWDRNAAHRTTEEFYRLAAARLRPGGVFAGSIPLVGLREEHLRSLLAAFRSAFPHALGVEAPRPGALILLGSNEPLVFRAADLLASWGEIATRTDLLGAKVRSVHELVAALRVDGEAIDSYINNARPNRDARAYVETDAEDLAAALDGGRLAASLRALHFDAERVLDYDGLSREVTGFFRLEVARAFRRSRHGAGGLLWARRAYESDPSGPAAESYAHFLKEEAGDLDSAIAVLRAARESRPDDLVVIRALADDLFTARRFEECDRLLTEAIDEGKEDAWFYVVRGKARLGLKQHERGLQDLLAGKELDRLQDNSGDINYFLAMAHKNLGNLEEAQNHLSRTIARNPRHLYAKLEIGENKLLLGTIDRAAFESEYLVPFNRARAETLVAEAEERLYEPQHAKTVEKNLNAVVNTTPRHYGAYLLLAEFYHRTGMPAKEREALERMIAEFGPRPEVVGPIKEYLRRTGGEGRVRAYGKLLR